MNTHTTFAVAILAALASSAGAQHCSHGRVIHGRTVVVSHVAPVIHHAPTVIVKKEVVVEKEYIPVAVPTAYPLIAVPVYSYVNAPGYVPGASFGSVMQPQAHADTERISADRIADLVMRRLEQRLRLAPGGEAPGGSHGDGPPAVKGPAAKGPAAKSDLSKAVGILTNRCASCHSGGASAGGGFSMFTAARELKALDAQARIDIYDAVYEKRMPKGGTPLSDEEVEEIRVWMRKR